MTPKEVMEAIRAAQRGGQEKAEAERMPEEQEEDPNLVDTNGSPESMDEDGEAVEQEPVDASPVLHSLVLREQHHPGGEITTIVTAQVPTATGIAHKHLTISGRVTLHRLALILAGTQW